MSSPTSLLLTQCWIHVETPPTIGLWRDVVPIPIPKTTLASGGSVRTCCLCRITASMTTSHMISMHPWRMLQCSCMFFVWLWYIALGPKSICKTHWCQSTQQTAVFWGCHGRARSACADCHLSFGMATASAIYSAFTEALEQIIESKGAHQVTHYLDSTLPDHPNSDKCAIALYSIAHHISHLP